jgi:hypothetical protein
MVYEMNNQHRIRKKLSETHEEAEARRRRARDQERKRRRDMLIMKRVVENLIGKKAVRELLNGGA